MNADYRLLNSLFFVLLALLLLAGPAPAVARTTESGDTLAQISLKADWPSLPSDLLNDQLEAFARKTMDDFRDSAMQALREMNEQGLTTHGLPFEQVLSFEQYDNNAGYISIVWSNYGYLGGAHGMTDLTSQVFQMSSSSQLYLQDLFYDLPAGLQLLSELSRSKLRQQLGDNNVEDMLLPGTGPDAANFSVFALLPGGLRLFFQPYQVGPYSIGTPSIDLSLTELGNTINQTFWQ